MSHRDSDRPTVELTSDERRRFGEIADQLRVERETAALGTIDSRRARIATWLSRFWGRSARRLTGIARRWWTGPLLLAIGVAALGYAGLASARLVVPAMVLFIASSTLTVLQMAGRLRSERWHRPTWSRLSGRRR